MDGNTLRWYLWYLWITTGPVCLLAALSILYGLYHRLPATMLVAVFPIVYFIVIARFVVRNDRTIMPLTPFLFLLAALFLYQLSQRIKDIDHDQRRLVVFNVFAVLLVLTLGYATYRIMDVQLKATAVDSRITARAWLPENIEAGSRIALEAYSIFVEPEQYDVVPVGSMIDQPPEWYIENDIEYLIFGQGLFGRFYRDPTRFSAQINQYEHFFQRFDLEHEFNDGDYTVLIYRVAP